MLHGCSRLVDSRPLGLVRLATLALTLHFRARQRIRDPRFLGVLVIVTLLRVFVGGLCVSNGHEFDAL